MKELPCAAIVVAGLGTGGTACVLRALELGKNVVAIEETDSPGGQLTTQMVPPDENPDIETKHSTLLYREFRNRIRDFYRKNYPLTDAALNDPHLNPGGGSVSPLCFEPQIGAKVITDMIQEKAAANGGKITLLFNTRITSATTDADRITTIRTLNTQNGDEYEITGDFFVDATELGDLIKLSGTEYVSGAESKNDTNEPHAVDGPPQPDNVQAFTWCLALGYDASGGNHTISKPEDYTFWQTFTPKMTPPWTGKLLSLNYTRPFDLKAASSFIGVQGAQKQSGYDFWLYRKIRSASNTRTTCSEISIMNWPQNDYFLGNIIDRPPSETERHYRNAKQLSLSMLYYLQTELGLVQLYPATEISGTPDGLAKAPYIRESRRIRALCTVSELDVGCEARNAAGSGRAKHYSDSIGTGSYRIDLHPSANGANYIDIPAYPFEIPLRTLIPVRMKNLAAGAKNIGTTHIANGCFRLHPVEWIIGEGAANHVCSLKKGECVQKIQTD